MYMLKCHVHKCIRDASRIFVVFLDHAFVWGHVLSPLRDITPPRLPLADRGGTRG